MFYYGSKAAVITRSEIQKLAGRIGLYRKAIVSNKQK